MAKRKIKRTEVYAAIFLLIFAAGLFAILT